MGGLIVDDRIVVIGEALIDLIQQTDGSYQAKPGGAPANASIALARLGAHVNFAGRMSTDGFGEQLHAWLATETIDLSLVERTADPTTLAVAVLDENGKATYSFYVKGTADWGWTLGAFENLKVTPPCAIVIGSLATAIDPGATVIEHLAASLHSSQSSTVVIDLNIRPGLGFDRHTERLRVDRQIRLAHVVKASDDDLAWLFPEHTLDETAAVWAADGHYVIMTRGADGATLFTPLGETVSVSAPVIALVDTVGAGDSFLGATLYGLQQRGALGRNADALLAAVSVDQWRELLTLAARVGAITCSRAGCNPPTLAELELA
ncbi:carbohydrate kinase [Alpinimonas psychrophila]|uniref:Fructokinase n=1 Tax=Alpinimonas psychrophila TaxID=748908 RepID=A0A7W3PN65_9MICO|nr:carbohydrate kinase [Alpinimonas psychrophila]MBA8828075.1 fructokinase [Alpinimonas psychrophila]